LSGNANEIKQANAKALAEAVQNSLNEQPTPTKTPASKRKITSNVKTRLLMLGKEYPVNDAKLADIYGKAFDDAVGRR
jgi:hypothetical protein